MIYLRPLVWLGIKGDIVHFTNYSYTNYMHSFIQVFFFGHFFSAHNTRVVWAWTWASRSAQTTSPNLHRHVAAELHTVQTHCLPAHGLVSLTRTHTHMHIHTLGPSTRCPFLLKLCRSIHACVPPSARFFQYCAIPHREDQNPFHSPLSSLHAGVRQRYCSYTPHKY